MLLAILIHAEPFKGQVPSGPIMRFDRPRQENRRFHAQLRHPVLHHTELERYDAGHFDGSTEGDFPIALGKVEISHAELSPFDMDGQKCGTASA